MITEKQRQLLQAVADASFGARFAGIDSVLKTIEQNFGRFRELQDESFDSLSLLIKEQEEKGRLEQREIKGRSCVGLTDEGKCCIWWASE